MQIELPHALLRPEAYPHPAARVEWKETHISWIFLAGDWAYKIKKPVSLGFLDYSTLEKREHYCKEELRLNRRLAPDIYKRVAPVTRLQPDGQLRIDGPGLVVDWAIEMLRLPAAGMMDAMLDRAELDNAKLQALANLLADFHAQAPTGEGVDIYGSFSVVQQNVLENFEQTEQFIGSTVSARLHRFLHQRAAAFLAASVSLLEKRQKQGKIREGHGDLHAGNICFTEKGIVVYDCIEFSARFRCADVGLDLAFLAMDLDLRCFRGFSRYLVHCYAKHAQDPDLMELMPFYKAYRAMVRAKVNSIKAASTQKEADRHEAMRYFHLAASYELPPSLILLCGLPGSGKSFVAKAVAEPFEALVLRSDVTRKVLAGFSPLEHATGKAREMLYAAPHTKNTYAHLLSETQRHLRENRTVIVDATFSKQAQRLPFLEFARSQGLPRALLHVQCPENMIQARMASRLQDPSEVSDANFEVYLKVKESFEPPHEWDISEKIEVLSGAPSIELCSNLMDLLVKQKEGIQNDA